MSQQELLKKVVRTLEQLGIDYMVTGSIVSSLQGEPRSTHGIDIVVNLTRSRTHDLAGTFPPPAYYFDMGDTIGEASFHYKKVIIASGFVMASSADSYLLAFFLKPVQTSGIMKLHGTGVLHVRRPCHGAFYDSRRMDVNYEDLTPFFLLYTFKYPDLSHSSPSNL